MGATCFCDFLELLTRCQPLLDAKAAPTLSALAAFAAEFRPVEAPPTPAAPKGAPRRSSQRLLGGRARLAIPGAPQR